MGHAGALVHGEFGTLQSKTRGLTEAGATVCDTIEHLVDRCLTGYR